MTKYWTQGAALSNAGAKLRPRCLIGASVDQQRRLETDVTRASDSDLAKIYRQTSTLGRMIDEGKRDSKWVSEVLQGAIEHREDGRLDFVAESTVVPVGMVEIDYETPLSELAAGMQTFAAELEEFEALPKPMHYNGGIWRAKLVLVHYKFNKVGDYLSATYDDIRRLMHEQDFVPVGTRELLACYRQKLDELNQTGARRIVPLGMGIPSAGTTGNVPCIFEIVSCLDCFFRDESYRLTTEHLTLHSPGNDNWYLARER